MAHVLTVRQLTEILNRKSPDARVVVMHKTEAEGGAEHFHNVINADDVEGAPGQVAIICDDKEET